MLFLLPLGFTFYRAFQEPTELISAAKNPYYLKIMVFTIKQAFLSTLASLVIGLPGAYLIARYKFTGKKVIKAISTIPFVLPSILVVLGFVIFFGHRGILNTWLMNIFKLDEPPLKILYSFSAIIIAHTFYNFPLILNLVGNYWEQLDTKVEKASETLGASQWRTFWSITFPRLLPSILSAACLVFLFCFTSFTIILVLGGGPQFTTIEVEIYRLAKISMNLSGAATLSIYSLVVCLIIIFIYSRFQKKMSLQEETEIQAPKKIKGFGAHIFSFLYIIFTLFFVLAPILSIVWRSVMQSLTRTGDKFISFDKYINLFTGNDGSSLEAITTSLMIGLAVGILSGIITVMICAGLRRRKGIGMEMFTMLPMAVSSIMIGLGYVIISRFFGQIPSYILIVLAHLVIAIPFAVKTILPEYSRIPDNLINCSYTLGATDQHTFFHIEIPLIKSAIFTAMVFAFAISMGEINATLILSSGNITTIPVLMFRLIGSYRFQDACALGTILIIVCFFVFLIKELMQRRHYA